jgi:cell division septation protein DedD
MSSTMTDSTNEKSTLRQNRLSPQKENFDFELPEVPVTSEQVNPASISLNASADHESTTIIPPAQPVPEIKTNFYVDYFDNRKKIPPVNPQPALTVETNQLVDTPRTIDNGSQDAMITEKNPEIATEETYAEPPLDSQAPVIDGAGMAVAVLSQFKSKQESINKQQEKLIQEFSQKIKTATTVTYAAVFFGVVALAAAATLGIMLSKTKAEVSDLAGTTIALKDNIRNIKASPDDLEGIDPSIDQLNEKVDDLTAQLNEIAAHQSKSSSSEKTAISKKSANTKPVDESQTTANVAEKKPAPEASVKTTPAAKAAKNTPAASSNTAINGSTAKPEATNKTATKTDLTVAKKINTIPDKALAVPPNDINNIVNNANLQQPSKPTKTAAPETTHATSPQPSSGWTVNLGSSNRLEDAKNTAARFAQKGVPVSISSVTVKNETRYRLQVKGFKTKDEAAAYANKAKDALKLNSVWINP